jgi:preprotein translocase subunit SecD
MKKTVIIIIGLLCITGTAAYFFFSGKSEKELKDNTGIPSENVAFTSAGNTCLKLQVMTEEMPDANPDMVIDQVIQILKKRLDRIGVSDYEFRLLDSQELGFAIAEEEFNPDIRKLLQSKGNLQFRETASSTDVWPKLEEIEMSMIMTDTTRTPVLSLISKNHFGACMGYANEADMEQINDFIDSPEVKSILKDVAFLWSAKPAYGCDDIFELFAINDDGRGAPLDGSAVENARAQLSMEGSAEVLIEMTRPGGLKWTKLTGDNIGKQIAIVLDGLVYTCPLVNQRIDGGMSSITGNFTLEEAESLAAMIDIGMLPVTVRIIAEKH